MKEQIIQDKLLPIVSNATNLRIENDFDMGTAVEILSALNKIHDHIEEERNKIISPLLEAIKVERNRWKKMDVSCETGINHIRNEMSRYETEKINNDKNRLKELTKQIGDGDISFETAVSKVEDTDRKITTPFGDVTFRKQIIIKLTNVNLIPREYMIPDENKIKEALKTGVVVPGAELEEIQIPINHRK